jgi:uncharacterized protein YjiS (DUF1127 family)
MSFSSVTLFTGTRAAMRRETTDSPFLQVVETIELWSERWHQRRALRELPDHARRDLGLSTVDVEAEASKPFWRA